MKEKAYTERTEINQKGTLNMGENVEELGGKPHDLKGILLSISDQGSQETQKLLNRNQGKGNSA